MQVSVIIVNYNVRYFLEQCLHSVLRAMRGVEGEIIVVDNASSDNSMAYLPPLFPSVHFISNNTNLGFARANNQALARCTGAYVLFLNPDTLVPENFLQKTLAYIQQQPNAGALGVRMLDGKGRFLPESKRAFPSPWVSFAKLSGLAALFPRSGFFNRYALGHLDEYCNHEVPVLAGACMLVRRELLLQLKGFDENYFLYGEDIDLSYRIQKAGYTNHYFAEMAIIHFKGESSANATLSRVRFFYTAMLVFVQKHYRTGSSKIIALFLKTAIAARGLLSAAKQLLQPMVDAVLFFASIKIIAFFWVAFVREGKPFGVPEMNWLLPVFSLLFILSAAIAGLYDKPYNYSKTITATVFALLSMLALYSLLPEGIRFSRGVVLLGGITGIVLIFFFRQVMHRWMPDHAVVSENNTGQTWIVASAEEYAAITRQFTSLVMDGVVPERISTSKVEIQTRCSFQDLPVVVKSNSPNRILFCVGERSLQEIILQLPAYNKPSPLFLFHIAGSGSIVGSHTLAPGPAVITSFVEYPITQSYQKRMKRVVDIVLAFFAWIVFPIHFLMHRKPVKLLKHALQVLIGSKTWVGYTSISEDLPAIKEAVIASIDVKMITDRDAQKKADSTYAWKYDWWNDIGIVLRNYHRLG